MLATVMHERYIAFYKCAVCPVKLNSKNLLAHHNRAHSQIPLQKDKIEFFASLEQRFACKLCNTIIENESRSQHIRRHHPERARVGINFDEVTLNQEFLAKTLNERTGSSDLDYLIDPLRPVTMQQAEAIEAKHMMVLKKKLLAFCTLCNTHLNPNVFIQHFARLHSDQLEMLQTAGSMH